jgi:hypothetical protein
MRFVTEVGASRLTSERSLPGDRMDEGTRSYSK